jgi:hypothetical protein
MTDSAPKCQGMAVRTGRKAWRQREAAGGPFPAVPENVAATAEGGRRKPDGGGQPVPRRDRRHGRHGRGGAGGNRTAAGSPFPAAPENTAATAEGVAGGNREAAGGPLPAAPENAAATAGGSAGGSREAAGDPLPAAQKTRPPRPEGALEETGRQLAIRSPPRKKHGRHGRRGRGPIFIRHHAEMPKKTGPFEGPAFSVYRIFASGSGAS